MAKWVCRVCGYVYEGENPPESCPICHAPSSKFERMQEEAPAEKPAVKTAQAAKAPAPVSQDDLTFACEHEVGIAKGAPDDIVSDLRDNFNGECSEVGMYLAMARVAYREGYPEVGLYYEKAAHEEAEHASKFAEMLGEVITDSTKKNLQMRIQAEAGACAGKLETARKAQEAGLEAIHDTVHEMAKDEARHGRAFKGLLDRYFPE